MQDLDEDAGDFHIDAEPVDESSSLEWEEHNPALDEEPLLSQVLTHGDEENTESAMVEVATSEPPTEPTVPTIPSGAEGRNRDPSTFDTMPFEFDEVSLGSGNPKAESLTPSPLGGISKNLPRPKTRSELDARIEALQYPSCMDTKHVYIYIYISQVILQINLMII